MWVKTTRSVYNAASCRDGGYFFVRVTKVITTFITQQSTETRIVYTHRSISLSRFIAQLRSRRLCHMPWPRGRRQVEGSAAELFCRCMGRVPGTDFQPNWNETLAWNRFISVGVIILILRPVECIVFRSIATCDLITAYILFRQLTEMFWPLTRVSVNSSHSQVNSSPRVDCDNHNYNSATTTIKRTWYFTRLLTVISSFGLHLSKVHSRCSSDRQRLKRLRSQKATHYNG